jgi:subtilisin family serine protease
LYEHDTLPHIPTNCTALFNGTSQATPQVSAAAALLYAAAGGHHVLSPQQVKQILESTADNINDPNQGHGRLNIYRAVAALEQDPGATYTGPHAVTRSATQTIAFAYSNSGGNRPTILDYDFPVGVPVAADGTFRIADVRPADATNFKVAVWYDANADGIIDAGDWIGTSTATCNVTSVCAIGTIKLQQVSGTYVLP